MAGETFLEKKHSGLGISSFIVSIATGVSMFLLFIAAGMMEISTPGGIDEDSVGAMLVGLFLFAFLLLSVLAIGLGIAALFQRDRKKLFAVLGIVFAASTIVITMFLMILGLMM